MPRRQDSKKQALEPRKGDPEAIAKAAMGRRAVAGLVRVAVYLPVATAQTLAARAVRERKNLDQVLLELIQRSVR